MRHVLIPIGILFLPTTVPGSLCPFFQSVAGYCYPMNIISRIHFFVSNSSPDAGFIAPLIIRYHHFCCSCFLIIFIAIFISNSPRVGLLGTFVLGSCHHRRTPSFRKGIALCLHPGRRSITARKKECFREAGSSLTMFPHMV